MTIWALETSTGTSATLVCYGAQEDVMGAVAVNGFIMDPQDPTIMDPFDLGIANAIWPCAACDVDEFGIPLCALPNSMGTCDASMEGEAEVLVPGDVTVEVTIHHTAPGTLTILGATGDIEILNPDETPFTSAYVTNEPSVPILIRAQSTFSGQVTLTARFLQENAQLDTQDLLIVQAVELKVEITDANDNDLPDEVTTIVGKHIVIHGKAPPNTVVTAHKWTIEGKKVKRYTQSMTKGEITDFVDDATKNPNDVSGQDVDFYWIAGSDDSTTPATETFTVTYTATIGGNNYSDSVEYHVDRPKVNEFSIKLTTLVPAVGLIPPYMAFGSIVDPTKAGIKWTGVVTAPAGGVGKIGYVQLTKADRRKTLDDATSTKKKKTTNGKFWLDRKNDEEHPVPQYNGYIKDIEDSGVQAIIRADSPAQGFTGTIKASADDKFHLYLMYKPDGGIWVTLGRLQEWHWKGTVTQTGVNEWSILQGSTASSADDADPPESYDSTDLPEWDSRFYPELPWEDDND